MREYDARNPSEQKQAQEDPTQTDKYNSPKILGKLANVIPDGGVRAGFLQFAREFPARTCDSD